MLYYSLSKGLNLVSSIGKREKKRYYNLTTSSARGSRGKDYLIVRSSKVNLELKLLSLPRETKTRIISYGPLLLGNGRI